jgi:hypothetical protein
MLRAVLLARSGPGLASAVAHAPQFQSAKFPRLEFHGSKAASQHYPISNIWRVVVDHPQANVPVYGRCSIATVCRKMKMKGGMLAKTKPLSRNVNYD